MPPSRPRALTRPIRRPRLSERAALACARVRLPLTALGPLLLFVEVFVPSTTLAWSGLAALVLGMALYLRVGTVRREPVEIASPVSGWWVPVHSPGTKVPSHGLHAYGQTYAVDLIADPDGTHSPGNLSWWPLARRPEEFPAFGLPIHAVADGVVVGVHARQRDHWARTSWPSLVWLLAESVRELFGVSRVVGNHVVVDHGGGVFSVYAHLRQGSPVVGVGDRVAAGDVLGQCGNSGNTSEPHLHVQLCDRSNLYVAAGLPFTFAAYEDADGTVTPGVPGNGVRFRAATGQEARPTAVEPTPEGVRRER